MIVKSISEAKAQLSALIERARAGEEVIIGKAGKPVVVLTRYSPSQRIRKPGALRGQIKVADDFDVLPRDVALAFGAVAEPGAHYEVGEEREDS